MKTLSPLILLLLISMLNCCGASLFVSAEDEASARFDSPLGIKDNYANRAIIILIPNKNKLQENVTSKKCRVHLRQAALLI